MTATETNEMPTGNAVNVTLTERAARRIKRVLTTEEPGAKLRVSVKGGGCSGFSYVFEVDRQAQDGDVTIERDGAALLIDDISLPYLEGSVIDFVDDLIGQSFKIQNPNATASCGCGTSFAL